MSSITTSFTQTKIPGGYGELYTTDAKKAQDARVEFFTKEAVQTVLTEKGWKEELALQHSYFIQGFRTKDIIAYIKGAPNQEPVPIRFRAGDELYQLVRQALTGEGDFAPKPAPVVEQPKPMPAPAEHFPRIIAPEGGAANNVAAMRAMLEQQKNFITLLTEQMGAFRASMTEVNDQRHREVLDLQQRMEEMLRDLDEHRSQDLQQMGVLIAGMQDQIASIQDQSIRLIHAMDSSHAELINEIDSRHDALIRFFLLRQQAPPGPPPPIPVPGGPGPRRDGGNGRWGGNPAAFGFEETERGWSPREDGRRETRGGEERTHQSPHGTRGLAAEVRGEPPAAQRLSRERGHLHAPEAALPVPEASEELRARTEELAASERSVSETQRLLDAAIGERQQAEEALRTREIEWIGLREDLERRIAEETALLRGELASLSRLPEENRSLQENLDGLSAERERLEQEKVALRNELESLRLTSHEASQRLQRQLEGETTRLQADLDGLSAEREQLEQGKVALQNELESLGRISHEEVQRLRGQLEEQTTRYQADLERWSAERGQLERERETLRNELESLRLTSHEEVQRLQGQLKGETTRYQAAQRSLMEETERASGRELERQSDRIADQALLERISELEARLREADEVLEGKERHLDQIARLISERESAEARAAEENGALTRQLEELGERERALDDELERLREAQKVVPKLQEALTRVQESLSEALEENRTIPDLKREIAALKSLAGENERLGQLVAELQKLPDELNVLQQQKAAVAARADQAREDADIALAQVSALRGLLGTAYQKQSELEQLNQAQREEAESTLQRHIDEANSDLAREKESFDEELAALRGQNFALTGRLEEAGKKIQGSQKRERDIAAKIGQLEGEIETLMGNRQELRDASESEKALLTELQREHGALLGEKQGFEIERARFERESSVAQALLTGIDGQFERIRAEAETALKGKRDEIDWLGSQLDAMFQRAQTEERERSALAAKLEELERTLTSERTGASRTTQKTLRDLHSEIERLKRDLADRERSFQSVGDDLRTQVKDHTAKVDRIAALERQAAEFETRQRDFREQLVSAQREAQQASAALLIEQGREHPTMQENRQLRTEITAAQKANNALETQVVRLRSESRAELARLRMELQEATPRVGEGDRADAGTQTETPADEDLTSLTMEPQPEVQLEEEAPSTVNALANLAQNPERVAHHLQELADKNPQLKEILTNSFYFCCIDGVVMPTPKKGQKMESKIHFVEGESLPSGFSTDETGYFIPRKPGIVPNPGAAEKDPATRLSRDLTQGDHAPISHLNKKRTSVPGNIIKNLVDYNKKLNKFVVELGKIERSSEGREVRAKETAKLLERTLILNGKLVYGHLFYDLVLFDLLVKEFVKTQGEDPIVKERANTMATTMPALREILRPFALPPIE